MTMRNLTRQEWDNEKPHVTDSISVKNQSRMLPVGSDIWGRPAKSQPVDISIILGLAKPFSSASNSDSIDASTIHYGQISKSINSLCEEYKSAPSRQITSLIYVILNGLSDLDNFLTVVSCFELSISLPKASRYGRGVTVIQKIAFGKLISNTTLKLDSLAVPCIIGVNKHERTLKQYVVASIWIDKSEPSVTENFQEVEQIVVKTIEESSFQTLEALAEMVAGRLLKHIVWAPSEFIPYIAGVRVRIEKPSAVVSADAPAIEIYRTASLDDPIAYKLYNEIMSGKQTKIPFPLEGRLDEFLQSSKLD